MVKKVLIDALPSCPACETTTSVGSPFTIIGGRAASAACCPMASPEGDALPFSEEKGCKGNLNAENDGLTHPAPASDSTVVEYSSPYRSGSPGLRRSISASRSWPRTSRHRNRAGHSVRTRRHRPGGSPGVSGRSRAIRVRASTSTPLMATWLRARAGYGLRRRNMLPGRTTHSPCRPSDARTPCPATPLLKNCGHARVGHHEATRLRTPLRQLVQAANLAYLSVRATVDAYASIEGSGHIDKVLVAMLALTDAANRHPVMHLSDGACPRRQTHDARPELTGAVRQGR